MKTVCAVLCKLAGLLQDYMCCQLICKHTEPALFVVYRTWACLYLCTAVNARHHHGILLVFTRCWLSARFSHHQLVWKHLVYVVWLWKHQLSDIQRGPQDMSPGLLLLLCWWSAGAWYRAVCSGDLGPWYWSTSAVADTETRPHTCASSWKSC